MLSLGTGELIMLGVIVLIVFSASRMASLGNALGQFVYSFKKASKGEGFVDAKATPVEPSRETTVTVKPTRR